MPITLLKRDKITRFTQLTAQPTTIITTITITLPHWEESSASWLNAVKRQQTQQNLFLFLPLVFLF